MKIRLSLKRWLTVAFCCSESEACGRNVDGWVCRVRLPEAARVQASLHRWYLSPEGASQAPSVPGLQVVYGCRGLGCPKIFSSSGASTCLLGRGEEYNWTQENICNSLIFARLRALKHSIACPSQTPAGIIMTTPSQCELWLPWLVGAWREQAAMGATYEMHKTVLAEIAIIYYSHCFKKSYISCLWSTFQRNTF